MSKGSFSEGIVSWQFHIDKCSDLYLGIIPPASKVNTYLGDSGTGALAWRYDGSCYLNGSNVRTTAKYGMGDTIKFQLDMSRRAITLFKNGTRVEVIDQLPDSEYCAAASLYNISDQITLQQPALETP
eukprot:gene57477-biopygen100383